MSSCLHESLSRPIYLASQTMRNFAKRRTIPSSQKHEEWSRSFTKRPV